MTPALPNTVAAVLYALANTKNVRAMSAEHRAELVEACQAFLAVHEADERRASRKAAKRSANSDSCADCDHPGILPCEAAGPGRYACTRAIGHDGNHVACGDKHAIAIWGPLPVTGKALHRAREVIEVGDDGVQRTIKSNYSAKAKA